MDQQPVTVVETAEFLKRAKRLLSQTEIGQLVEFIAYHPTSGEVIPGTGGVRKLRWMLSGAGKRGGARIIYYFRNEKIPIFLFSCYSKSTKVNLTDAEKNELKSIITKLVKSYP